MALEELGGEASVGKWNAQVFEGKKLFEAEFLPLQHSHVRSNSGMNLARADCQTVAFPPTVWIMATSLFATRPYFSSSKRAAKSVLESKRPKPMDLPFQLYLIFIPFFSLSSTTFQPSFAYH